MTRWPSRMRRRAASSMSASNAATAGWCGATSRPIFAVPSSCATTARSMAPTSSSSPIRWWPPASVPASFTAMRPSRAPFHSATSSAAPAARPISSPTRMSPPDRRRSMSRCGTRLRAASWTGARWCSDGTTRSTICRASCCSTSHSHPASMPATWCATGRWGETTSIWSWVMSSCPRRAMLMAMSMAAARSNGWATMCGWV